MQPRGELRRQLGLASAAALVVGECIGVGIFLTPAGMSRGLGAPLWILLVWLVMGAMALCGALCYGELAVRFPEAGGSYVYLREAFGRPAAFLYGWVSLLAIDPGVSASLAAGVAPFVVAIVPALQGAEKAIAIATVLILATVNIVGVGFGAGVLRALTAAKLGLLAFIVLWGFGNGLGDWSNFVPFADRPKDALPLEEALAGGLVGAFFAFGGWWDASKVAGEVRDPRRTLPRALVLGVSLVLVAYVVVSAAFLYLVPREGLATNEAFAARAGEALFGTAGGPLFAAVVVVAVFGSLGSMLMSMPRVYFAMARDGLFFPELAHVHPCLGTPVRAIAVQATLACTLVLWGTFDEILGYFIFVSVLFMALSVAALFVLRRRASPLDLPPFGYPWAPAFYLLTSAALLVLLAAGNPVQSSRGLGMVALGVPAYYLLPRPR